jgi:hypothetical protein
MISVLFWSTRQSWSIHLLNNIEEINGWHIVLIARICITNWITTSPVRCMLLIWQLPSLFGKHCLIAIILYICVMMAQNTWHIAFILYLCVTMTQSTLTQCYHLIHVCHNDTKYIDIFLSSYTWASQWHKVHWHIVIILHLCVTMTQSTLTHCCHLVPVTQSTLTYFYHLIHERHNDTKYTDTLLSSYTCVSQCHKVHCHIVVILYMCVTMTQNTLTPYYHPIHVCHNDTKHIDTLLSSYTCVS